VRPTTYVPEVMRIFRTMLRIVRKMRRRSASRRADKATPPRRDVRPNPDAASGYNMATRWRSNPDIPQNVRDSQDRSQGYLHEDGEDNLYRRSNDYRISVTMTDPEVIE
jgi:hypothetical protein